MDLNHIIWITGSHKCINGADISNFLLWSLHNESEMDLLCDALDKVCLHYHLHQALAICFVLLVRQLTTVCEASPQASAWRKQWCTCHYLGLAMPCWAKSQNHFHSSKSKGCAQVLVSLVIRSEDRQFSIETETHFWIPIRSCKSRSQLICHFLGKPKCFCRRKSEKVV